MLQSAASASQAPNGTCRGRVGSFIPKVSSPHAISWLILARTSAMQSNDLMTLNCLIVKIERWLEINTVGRSCPALTRVVAWDTPLAFFEARHEYKPDSSES